MEDRLERTDKILTAEDIAWRPGASSWRVTGRYYPADGVCQYLFNGYELSRTQYYACVLGTYIQSLYE